MAPHAEGDILSRIEFVLPKNVLQTACNLSCGLGATFVSTNQAKRTATHIKLFKRNDESVSINCTGNIFQMSVRPPFEIRGGWGYSFDKYQIDLDVVI